MVKQEVCPAAETYRDIEKMIFDICYRFRKQYGDALGSFEDLVGEANVAFMEAYRRYDPAYARFTTWLYWRVFGALMDKLRQVAARNARHPTVGMSKEIESTLVRSRHTDRVDKMISDASDDAAQVLRLIRELPADMELSIRQMGGRATPKRVVRALSEYLRDLGWTSERIGDAIDELREMFA
jgi:RNA polymerase sigma factor (sigma-70 family)